MSNELLINDPKSNNSEDMSNKQIEEMASIVCHQYNGGKCLVYGKCEDNCSFREDYKRLYNAVYRKQSENTVEVVRCKDCEHYGLNSHIIGIRNNQCIYFSGYDDIFTDPNDYCSFAKMKGGE